MGASGPHLEFLTQRFRQEGAPRARVQGGGSGGGDVRRLTKPSRRLASRPKRATVRDAGGDADETFPLLTKPSVP